MSVFDTTACMLAGGHDSVTEHVKTMVSVWGKGRSTLIGGGSAATPWAMTEKVLKSQFQMMSRTIAYLTITVLVPLQIR
jgi:hypothetical protein